MTEPRWSESEIRAALQNLPQTADGMIVTTARALMAELRAAGRGEPPAEVCDYDHTGWCRSHGHQRATCPHGDATCPCPDGDQCHYEATEDVPAMECPRPAGTCPVCRPAEQPRTTHHKFVADDRHKDECRRCFDPKDAHAPAGPDE